MVSKIAISSFHEIDGCVHCDSHNPCRKSRVLAEGGQLVISAKERLLRRLFRIGLIAGNTKSNPSDRAEVPVHQHAIGVPVASEYILDRLCLRLVHSPIRQWILPPVRYRSQDFLAKASDRF